VTTLGYAYVFLALLSVLGGSASYVLACRAKTEEQAALWTEWGRHGFRFAALMTVLTSVYLMFFFVTHHYELDYVFHNSSRDMPLVFQFSAFWSGQEGSFLLWAFWTGLIGVLLTYKTGKEERTVMPFFGLVYAFILTMVICVNPFKTTPAGPSLFAQLLGFLHISPMPDPAIVLRSDGMGLNPLLQDYWMAIHPPTLFLGYSLMAVPFAYAMGALARQDYRDWIRAAAPWCLAAVAVLTLALSMGGHWAYRTLGWGGFWGWDPVENASFVPLLCGLALVHGLFLQRGKNAAAQRGNIGLAITAFIAVMYASYLTRSGVLSQFSNHSFSALPHGWFLLASLLFFVAIGYGFFLYRYKSIPSLRAYESVTSREFGFYLSVVILMIAAVLTAVGTSTPIITSLYTKPSTVQQSFYNWTMAPVGVLIGLMLALYPLSTRNGIAGGQLWKRTRVPLFAALAVTAVVGVGSVHIMDASHFATAVGLTFAGVLALGVNLGQVTRLARSGGLRSAGGYIAHVGFGVLLLGIVCCSLYSRTERIKKMTMTQPGRAFGYEFRMVNTGEAVGTSKIELPLLVTPKPDKGSQSIWQRLEFLMAGQGFAIRPSMMRDKNGSLMASPGIHSHPLYDLYVAPVEFDPGTLASMPITLKPGEFWQMGPIKLYFAGVSDVGRKDDPDYSVRANLLAIRGGKHVPAQPVLNLRTRTSTIIELPGGSKININPDTTFDGAMTFDFAGPNSKRSEPSAAVDVTIKPLIWIVWLGMILLVTGALLSVRRRTLENSRRKAELLDEASPADEPNVLPSA
jgi:cytochrome c-type biogenesis protein CcmF